MENDSKHDDAGLNAAIDVEPIVLRDWPNVALSIAALSGVWIAHGVAVWTSESSTEVVTLTATLVLASLAALGLAISKLVSSSQSRLHHVFCGRRMLALGGFLLAVAAILAGSIVRLDQFRQLTARGQITVDAIAGMGFVGAVIVCMIGAGVAFDAAWDACHEERHWGESLGVHLP